MGWEHLFVISEICHSPTLVCEWQQTNLQPTHRSLSRPSAKADHPSSAGWNLNLLPDADPSRCEV